MIKIDKKYTIKFSYAGIDQYAIFNEVNGKIYNPQLTVYYGKGQYKLDHLDKIGDILAEIKKFSYANRAEIYLINGQPIKYEKNKKAKEQLSNFSNEFNDFIEQKAITYFKEILVPVIEKYSYNIGYANYHNLVLIEKIDGEFDNIKDRQKEFEIEYLCYKFLNVFKDIKISMEGEQGTRIFEFSNFMNYVPLKIVKGLDLFINI